jgi:hypothetical protein
MKINVSVLALAIGSVNFIGCKDSGANTGDVAVDFLIDLHNDKFAKEGGYANDEQRKKYSPLAKDLTECTTKVSAACDKMAKDPKLKEMITHDEGKKVFVAMIQLPTASRPQIAQGLCNRLKSFK